MRKPIGIFLCCLFPLAITMMSLEQGLLSMGILNTKDLPPHVGNEIGTFSEYMLNVWHWAAVEFLLMLFTLPGFYVGLRLLLANSEQAVVHTKYETTR